MNPFSGLLALVTAFLQWRTEEAKNAAAATHYNLQRQIENDIATDENEITRLRDLRTAAGDAAAERLRNRIVRAQGIAATLQPPQPAPGGGSAGANH